MSNLNHSGTFAARLFGAAVLFLAIASSALAGVHYVDVNSAAATPPYTNWTTAATNIQDAVDAAVAGDEIVVTNGTYYPVVVDKALSLRSVNGAQFATIDGHGSARCVSLNDSASLSSFTLTNGFLNGYSYGAGVSGQSNAVVSDCVITGNRVSGVNNTTFFLGGGAYGVTLNNCSLTSNSVTGLLLGITGFTNTIWVQGGGAYRCTLNNCTLRGNSANATNINHFFGRGFEDGGGVFGCTLNNCIVYSNTLNGAVFNYWSSTLSYCCTTPQPDGVGNITNAPLFVDQAGGDLRLQSNSPCINAGNNSYVKNATDLDGNPHIAGGTVDIGAYEFQSPVSMISYAWLQQFNLPINSSTDTADPDGDGVNNYREWLAGSDPTNRFSFPPLLTLIPYGAAD